VPTRAGACLLFSDVCCHHTRTTGCNDPYTPLVCMYSNTFHTQDEDTSVSLPQLLATPSGIVTVVCECAPELAHAFFCQTLSERFAFTLLAPQAASDPHTPFVCLFRTIIISTFPHRTRTRQCHCPSCLPPPAASSRWCTNTHQSWRMPSFLGCLLSLQ
jgi:hypothetical protein